ncbi:MAG: hypothetical protein ABI834_09650 [Ginsengibacter sp.]
MKKIFTFLFIGFISCTSASKNKNTSGSTPMRERVELPTAQIKVPGITIEKLDAGKKLYVMDCTSCHAMKHPSNYTMDQWDTILPKMYIKSKMSDENQKKLIRDYVMAKSK